MDYVEVYHVDMKVGIIAQDADGNIIVKAINQHYKKILNSFILPFKISKAVIENDVSISLDEIILTNDNRWISYLSYNIPSHEYYVSKVMKASRNKIEKMVLK